MNLFKKEMDREIKSLGFKSLRKVKMISDHQTGTSIKSKDRERDAMPPGKRISKLGRVYYEYRKNRTDLKGKKV